MQLFPLSRRPAHAGFDWLLFDMEHTPSDLQIIGTQQLAVRSTPSAAIVGVPSADVAFIKYALDAGSSTRGGGYTRYRDYMAHANDEVGLILQIKLREALDELAAICAVPDEAAVFIGPSDLTASLGHPDHRRQRQRRAIAGSGRDHGRRRQ